ncbi:hypothetical protein [Mycolicibacterium thermoresistibile]
MAYSMKKIPQLRDLDSRTWATATWTIPFTVQFVLLLSVIMLWILGKATYFADAHERGWFVSAAAITLLFTLPMSALLLMLQSSRVRGLAVAIAGSSVIVATGMITYSFLVLQW